MYVVKTYDLGRYQCRVNAAVNPYRFSRFLGATPIITDVYHFEVSPPCAGMSTDCRSSVLTSLLQFSLRHEQLSLTCSPGGRTLSEHGFSSTSVCPLSVWPRGSYDIRTVSTCTLAIMQPARLMST
ncbi:hypothetical protein BaRGS_00010946 [Batillaria attramentaria]|uniref:Uncharacterized protein n=1 Tax=Batillaria attramentaria TaxID=370345 RepID=A0ABD0LES7_9CAEN